MGEGVESAVSQAFFLQAYNMQNLGDLHHLLAQRPVNILRPFLQKTYFSLKVVGQEPPSKKALDKVAFLQSKGVVGYNKKKN